MKSKNIKLILILSLLLIPLRMNSSKLYFQSTDTNLITRKIRSISTPSLSPENVKELSGLQTIKNIPHPIVITDFSGKVVWANESFIKNFSDKTDSYFIQQSITKFLNLEEFESIFDTTNSTSSLQHQLGNTEDSNGTIYKTNISHVYDSKGNPRGFYFELFDNSEAIKDSLTGAYNRTAFNDKLKKEIARAHRDGPVSLLMMDLDNFKPVNDTYGHQVGDELLKEIVNITNKTIREMDTLARFGGDEFAVILPEATSKNAKKVAERVKKRINETIGKILEDKKTIQAAEIKKRNLTPHYKYRYSYLFF